MASIMCLRQRTLKGFGTVSALQKTTTMKLKLKNIGALKHAEVTLHRLCVIAGENDNGKSTIGKVVFCIVKAISRYEEDLQESKKHELDEKFEGLYFLLRKSVQKDDAFIEHLDFFRKLEFNPIEDKELLPSIDTHLDKIFEHQEFEKEIKREILGFRDEITAILDRPENRNHSIQNALRKVFLSEFDGVLLRHGETEGSIQLFENDLTLIHIVVSNNGIRLEGDVQRIALNDATFVETPIILNMHDVLSRSQTQLNLSRKRTRVLGLPTTTLHTKDLYDKLRSPAGIFEIFELLEPEMAQLLEEIQEIIDGEIVYDREYRDFVFVKQGQPVPIKNTASGIKVLGLLRILMINDFISKHSVLILDEPENHLHPKWQLKLAQILVKLVAAGFNIMVSSHSPYLIEALQRGVERAKLGQHAGFFLAENQSITDKDSLGDIFAALAAPFEEFQKMDAESLRDE